MNGQAPTVLNRLLPCSPSLRRIIGVLGNYIRYTYRRFSWEYTHLTTIEEVACSV